jgi:hypothetical protein
MTSKRQRPDYVDELDGVMQHDDHWFDLHPGKRVYMRQAEACELREFLLQGCPDVVDAKSRETASTSR